MVGFPILDLNGLEWGFRSLRGRKANLPLDIFIDKLSCVLLKTQNVLQNA